MRLFDLSAVILGLATIGCAPSASPANPVPPSPSLPTQTGNPGEETPAEKPANAPTTDTPGVVPPGDTTEKPEKSAEKPAEPAKPTEIAAADDAKFDGKYKLGDLIAPFTPPTLEELNAKVKWVDKPVLDSMELRKEKDASEKAPTSVAEALKLRNNNDKAVNAKILDTLGRLPEKDSDANWDTEINRFSAGDINSTFPLFISSVAEFDVQDLIGFGIIGFDWKFNHFASKDAVVSWQSSEDGLYDKFVLRDDLTWSDGKPITAHDIVFSYKAIMTKAVPVKAVRQGTDLLNWVEAYDDHTVVYFHKESLVTNILNISFPIIPKHIYETVLAEDPLLKKPANAALEDKPVVGGPYVLTSRSRGQEIELERRESYFLHNGKEVRTKPYFKKIRFRIRPETSVALLSLKTGDLDEMLLNPDQWKNQTNNDEFYKHNTKVYATEWTSFHFIWNFKDPRFEDKRVRKALALAYDHKELLEKLLFNMCEPATGNFHPSSVWAPVPAPKPIQQNLDEAEDLLDAAGWKDSDGDGVRDKKIKGVKVDFEFTLLTSNIPDRIDICNLMRESLQSIGIRCNVKPMEFAAVLDKLQSKDFQASFGGWGTGTDPDSSENIFGTGELRNYGSYSNPKVDELFKAGKKEFDLKKREKIYREIATILWDDQVYCWLYYRNAFYGFNKSLRGYMFSPRGPYHYGPGFSSIYKPAAQP